MEKHQEEYIKLISEKFKINGEPKRASYKRFEDIYDSGIVIELESSIFNPRLVFLSDTPESYFHRWVSQLGKSNLPRIVWITTYNDKDLCIHSGFYI